MTRSALHLLAFALLGVAPAVAAQDSTPVAALLSRGSNPDGPFAARWTHADALVARARAQVGKRYRYASASPELGFDCSGLVTYVLGSFGVKLPHNAARMAHEGSAVRAELSSLRPGDLLMFVRGSSARISHVGIYVGDGRMVHASTAQRRVIESPIPSAGEALRLRAVRRVLRDSSTAIGGSE